LRRAEEEDELELPPLTLFVLLEEEEEEAEGVLGCANAADVTPAL
jgi:hypothetical protein